MKPIIEALNNIDMILKRNRNAYKKKLKELKEKELELEDLFIVVKDYKCRTYDDLQELYGAGEITSSQFERYVEKLNELQEKSNIEFQRECYEETIRFLTTLIINIEHTKEIEMNENKGE